MVDINLLEKKIDDFLGELELEYYLAFSGLKDRLETAEIYEKYSDLNRKELIEEVRDLFDSTHEKKIKKVYSFLVTSYIYKSIAKINDALSSKEVEERIRINSERFSLRIALAYVRREPRRENRSKVYGEICNVIEEFLNPLLANRIYKIYKLVEELEFKDYTQFCEFINQVDLGKLRQAAERFLSSTERVYREYMEALVKENLGISLSEAERHDIIYLLSNPPKGVKPRVEMIAFLLKTLKGLGVELDKMKNVLLDVEDRPNKSPRAFVAAVKIPEDVRLVVLPTGGIRDYQALFHEAGHALHFAFTDPALPTAFKRLGPSSITETYAFLIEYILLQKRIAEKLVGYENTEKYLLHSYASYIHFLRRYSAKLIYELELHKARNLEKAKTLYEQIMSKYLLYRYNPSIYLYDVDLGFYTGEYLRAWFFEAMLRKYLEESYGDWVNSRKAGDFVKSLWRIGFSKTLEELAEKIGYREISEKNAVEIISKPLF